MKKKNIKYMDKRNILARTLRKNGTIQERRIWNLLKNHQFHNLKFKRQYPIGNYIVDFICKEVKIIIEIDGSQHLEAENRINDEIRTKYFETLGYKVIRFYNNEVYENIEGVMQKLEMEIDNRLK